MKPILMLWTILTATILISCGQSDRPKRNETTGQHKPGQLPIVVDYKSDTYKISLGARYQISEEVIDWQWAALADEDNKIDSSGIDEFMSLDEPFINYEGTDYLPSLHIQTNKNRITSFTCSILFDLGESANSAENFLHLISKDIKKLQDDNVRKSILTNGIFETVTENYIETYQLTIVNGFGNERFEYTIKYQ